MTNMNYHYDSINLFDVHEHLLVEKLVVVHFVIDDDEHVEEKRGNLAVVHVHRL